MSRLLGLGFAALVFGLGCSSEKPVEPIAAEQHSHDMHMSEEKAEMNEAFAELSEADRKAVEAQKTCPVSDQPLGSMGTPIKVTVDGRDLFVCCASCVEKAEENFDEYYSQVNGNSK